MPKVSVIIPTHNRPELLAAAINSAREAGADSEVIVVDDASCDETAELCLGLKSIRYIRLDRHQGVAGARNVGLLASTGDYVSFLDDDDLRLPFSLDRQVKLLEENREAGMACGTVLLGEDEHQWTGQVITPPVINDGDLFWQIVSFDYSPLPIAVVARKECFLKVGLFKKHLASIEDWDMWARIAEVFPVLTSEEPVALYRQSTVGSEQLTSNLSAQYQFAAHHQTELLSLPRALSSSDRVRKAARSNARYLMATHLLRQASAACRKRSYRAAFHNSFTGLRLNPFLFLRLRFLKGLRRRLTGSN